MAFRQRLMLSATADPLTCDGWRLMIGARAGTDWLRRLLLARQLHPGAWWIWALGLATAASRTTNPLLLGLIAAVAGLVVAARRTHAPWARAYASYLRFGLIVIGIRVLFRAVFGGDMGDHVLLDLPRMRLPEWAAGVMIGGPVTLEAMLAAVYDGARLAVLLACVGAANALANPRRLLRLMPRALHDIATALVVAFSLAPQIIESIHRVRRARRLRGGRGHVLTRMDRIVVPVLEDALERSLAMAAAMESRGHGRSLLVPADERRVTNVMMAAGLVGTAIGLYGLLDGTTPPTLSLPVLVIGVAVASVGLRRSGRRVIRSRYRPDRWMTAEWLVAGSGVAASLLTAIGAGVDPGSMHPSLQPLVFPSLNLIATIGVLVAATPAWLSPDPSIRDPKNPTTDGATAAPANDRRVPV